MKFLCKGTSVFGGIYKLLYVRFFLILVSLFYVEVSVTRPVFHIWYCTRGFLFRLKIVLPPSWSGYCVPGLLFEIHNIIHCSFFKVKSQLYITSWERNSPCWPDQFGITVRLYAWWFLFRADDAQEILLINNIWAQNDDAQTVLSPKQGLPLLLCLLSKRWNYFCGN